MTQNEPRLGMLVEAVQKEMAIWLKDIEAKLQQEMVESSSAYKRAMQMNHELHKRLCVLEDQVRQLTQAEGAKIAGQGSSALATSD